jgi:hypothetical protein
MSPKQSPISSIKVILSSKQDYKYQEIRPEEMRVTRIFGRGWNTPSKMDGL